MDSVCDDCGSAVDSNAAGGLAAIKDLADRLEPGAQVPSCECPRCGALAYLRPEPVAPRGDLRQIVDRLSVERMLSESTILRVTLDFIEEHGLGRECIAYLRRRSR